MTYSIETQAQAMALLALNQNDWEKTSEITGVAARTLQRWSEKLTSPDKIGVKTLRSSELGQILSDTLTQVIQNPPASFTEKGWGITVGILVDKLLLLEGKPTERIENISKQLGHITDEQLDIIEAEFESRLGTGDREGGTGTPAAAEDGFTEPDHIPTPE